MNRSRALLLIALLVAAMVQAEVVTELDNLGTDLRFGVSGRFLDKLKHPPRDGRIVLPVDVDGDGHDEIALWTGIGVVAEQMGDTRLKAMWQVNVPVELAWTLTEGQGRYPRFCDLGLAADINNDGQEEIFLTISDPDRTRWYLYVIDPALEEIVLEVALPLGPDRRENGNWDGRWTASGILPPGQASPNACLVLTTMVQYDAKPRGFSAVDVVTGEIVWRFAMGGNPAPERTWVGDLENDGIWEIVSPASGPDNLGGEAISGMSDDQSWLVVVGADGVLRRRTPLGGVVSGAMIHVTDLDGDGIQEILAATTNVSQGQKQTLRIFTPEFELTARIVTPGGCRGMSSTPHADGTASIFMASESGILARYRYRAGKLDPPIEAVASGEVGLGQHGDLLPRPGNEILVSLDKSRRTAILDEDLKPLLMTEPRESYRGDNVTIWSPEPGTYFMIAVNQSAYIAQVQKNPVRFPWLEVALSGATMAIFVGAIAWHRRRTTKPPASRDALARLHFDLEVSGHGAMTVTRSLRELQTMLSTLRGEFEVGSGLRPHARRTFEDFAETDLITIRDILDRADASNFEAAVVRETRQALEQLVDQLERLVAKGLPSTDVEQQFPAYKRDAEALERGLQALRRSIESQFSCDLPSVLERVLWAREFELQSDKIAVQAPVTADDNWSVLIDSKDLRFVLDNLVGNAIRAMAAAPRRDLTVSLVREGGNVICRVSDTGTGIPEEARTRVIRTRFTTREGGGSGLFRSSQLLNRWGGVIELEKTEVGRGSTFAVRLAGAGSRLRLVEPPGEAAG